jgi:hypothetical protein
MADQPHAAAPPLAWGTVSVVLGSIALMLFFLPILSIHIAVWGLLAGGIGLIRAIIGVRKSRATPLSRNEQRWAIIGCTVCATVIVLGFIIAYAPLGETPGRSPPSPFWEPPGRPYVPPPARPQ